jgi:hypothetical protein
LTPQAPEPLRRPGVFRIALYMFLMAIVISWLSFAAMPLAIGWEFSPAAVDHFPRFGLGLGAAVGLAMGFSQPFRESVWFVFVAILLGGLAWFFIVLAAGLGVGIVLEGDAFDQMMEKVDTVATWIAIFVTVACLATGAYAIVYGKADALRGRFRRKPRGDQGSN